VLFIVIRQDKPESVPLRKSARPRHLLYLDSVIGSITAGGAMLDEHGDQIGSMLLIDVPDRAAAEDFAAADPFVEAGLFASTTIRAFRPVFKDGEWL